MTTDSHERLDAEIAALSAQGWAIVGRTERGVQMRRKRKPTALGIPVLVLLPFLLGFAYRPCFSVALIGLVIVLIGYLTAKTEYKYLS